MKIKKYLALPLFVIMLSDALAGEFINCGNASSTIEINKYATKKLEKAQAVMSRYLKAAISYYSSDTELIDAINLAQEGWHKYHELH